MHKMAPGIHVDCMNGWMVPEQMVLAVETINAVIAVQQDWYLPISSLAPRICQMPVIQQHTDASISTLYGIYWIVINQDLGT